MTISKKTTVVVLGAGASKFASNGSVTAASNKFQPPLAVELFDFTGGRSDLYRLMDDYPGARAVTEQLRRRVRINGDSSWNIEQELSALATHQSGQIRQQFKHVPPFLREYLDRVSREFKGVAGNYFALARDLIADTGGHVVFVSLNYDTLLERALEHFDMKHTFANSIHSFLGNGFFKLIKPHGSVDWFVPIGEYPQDEWFERARELNIESLNHLPVLVNRSMTAVTRSHPQSKLWYPLITAPLANKGPHSMVCPPEHVDALKQAVNEADKLLFIGTSGQDGDLLEVMADAAPHARLTAFVGANGQDAKRTYNNVAAVLPSDFTDRVQFSAVGFDEFVNGADTPNLATFAKQ